MASRDPVLSLFFFFPPLHRAARDGDTQLVERRLAKGDDVNCLAPFTSDGSTITPLSLAVLFRQRECVKIILNAGATTLRPVDSSGRTVLYIAISYGERDIVELLLEAGADVNDVWGSGCIPLCEAAAVCDVRCLELLLSRGAIVDMVDCSGLSPLMHAARQGSEDCVRALLTAGADPSKTLRALEMIVASLRYVLQLEMIVAFLMR